MSEKLVGLGDVELVGVDESGEGEPLVVVIRSRLARPTCEGCGGRVWSKGYRTVVLVDLPAFGRPVRLSWRKRRWACPNPDCVVRSFVEQVPTIGPERALLTSRAARWVTIGVGRRGRPVERISDRGRTRLRGLLDAGDPHGDVRTAWHAKETVRGIYEIDSIAVALRYTLQLADDLQDESCPPEINKLGRTIARWTPQITNWHISKVTNGPTEALNNLIKRIKRAAFGFRNFGNYRIRALLYAGKPNWDPTGTYSRRSLPTEIR